MLITGHIIEDPVEKGTGNWKRAEFAVVSPAPPGGKEQYFPIQAYGWLMDQAMQLSPGDLVRIDATLTGSKWEKDGVTRYYLNLKAESIDVATKFSTEDPASQEAQTEEAPLFGEEDDLPF